MDSYSSALKVKTAMDSLGSPFILCYLTNEATFIISPEDDGKDFAPISPVTSSLSSTSISQDTP
jgi:hypothetical protein